MTPAALILLALASPAKASDDQVSACNRVLQLTVKLSDGSAARARVDGSLSLKQPVADLQRLISEQKLTFRPLLRTDPALLDDLGARAAARGQRAADLQTLLIVELPDPTRAHLEAVAQALRGFTNVDYAFIAHDCMAPPEDIDPVTDDFTGLQDYREPDPGVNADYAAARGVTGANVGLADCEYGWRDTHEDLPELNLEAGQTIVAEVFSYRYDQHGTAAVGIIAGQDNGYGVTGLAPAVRVSTWPEYTEEEGGRRATAIANAIAASVPGDVVLLEMQADYRVSGLYGPAEVDPSVFTVVQAGAAAGVTVVAAAGNSAEDLDSEWYVANYLNMGDSGAILVGAGSDSSSHSPLYFSTYGERVNLQGWGENVFSTGYGDYFYPDRDLDQAYTAAFNGTSSASAMVAGVAVLVQDFLIARGAPPLDPLDLRELLITTGLAQGTGVHIGPLPDLAAALRALDADEDDAVSETYGGDDCDDADPNVYPDATERPGDGVDNNCDGVADTGAPDTGGDDTGTDDTASDDTAGHDSATLDSGDSGHPETRPLIKPGSCVCAQGSASLQNQLGLGLLGLGLLALRRRRA